MRSVARLFRDVADADRALPPRGFERSTQDRSRNARGWSHRIDRECAQVLWIDDEVNEGDPAVRLMECEGLRVRCAASGDVGLSMAMATHYDGIILDLRIADLADGLTVLQRLRSATVTAPILMLTGFGTVEHAVAALKAGATDFRSKPILADELARIITQLISVCGGSVGVVRSDERVAALKPALARTTRETVLALNALATADLTALEFVALARRLRQAVGRGARMRNAGPVMANASVNANVDLVRSVLGKIEDTIRAGQMPGADVIAVACHSDRAGMRTALRFATGCGFRECRRAIRLRAAIRLVIFGSEQFAQIAYRLGYEHPGQFDRDFKLTFGMTPGECRSKFCLPDSCSSDPIC